MLLSQSLKPDRHLPSHLWATQASQRARPELGKCYNNSSNPCSGSSSAYNVKQQTKRNNLPPVCQFKQVRNYEYRIGVYTLQWLTARNVYATFIIYIWHRGVIDVFSNEELCQNIV